MRIRAVKRQEPWTRGSFFIFLLAVVLSLGASVMLLAVQGKPPLEAVRILWIGAFGAGYSIEDTVLKAVPIYLCALGVAFTFRMQVWNIGAEGQYALGAIGATWAALTFPAQPAWILLPLMFLCSAIAGGFWAFIPAILKTRLKVNEIISTLMFNYIGILFLDYLVYGIWKDKASHGFPLTRVFPDAAIIPNLPGTRLHWGLALCIVTGFIFWSVMRFTRLGYELKASGSGPRPSRYARMPYNFLVCLVMVACGVLAGWAGLIETSASLNRLQPSVMAGYGFTAIVVAWLANLNPLWIALSAFLLAALRVGVENLQLLLQVPAAFGGILEGMILLTVLAARFFVDYKLVISRS